MAGGYVTLGGRAACRKSLHMRRFGDGTTAILSNGSAGGSGSPVDAGGGVVRSTSTNGGISTHADTDPACGLVMREPGQAFDQLGQHPQRACACIADAAPE